ncbi:MAG TPA: DUF1028 domain-containing protein [Candidatus Acidoferrales bacterium]|nr:DUF1028 domain-containing protein [Candidatus Acidoferrales bacterium]
MKPSTFSIVAADLAAGELGVAVQSKFLAVGAAVPWLEGGVGAVATQAWANTSYGPRGLALLRAGSSPREAIDVLVAEDEGRSRRQIGIVDARGKSATYTGEECTDWAGGVCGDGFAAQGNILAGSAVVDGLVDGFLRTQGTLAQRLLAALRAAQRAGGDKRGQQSAALVVVKPNGGYGGYNDRYIDLRVDDALEPIEQLAHLLDLHNLYFAPPKPADILKIDDAIGAELVDILVKFGALAKGHRQFDKAAFDAFERMMGVENLEERLRNDGTVDRQTLEYFREKLARSVVSR